MNQLAATYNVAPPRAPVRTASPSSTPVAATRIGYSPDTMRYSPVTDQHHLRPAQSLSYPPPQPRQTYFDVGVRFGARLRELRRSANMTQIDMAVAFGIDRSYISDVECGKKGISLATLEVVALGFHTTLSELLRDL